MPADRHCETSFAIAFRRTSVPTPSFSPCPDVPLDFLARANTGLSWYMPCQKSKYPKNVAFRPILLTSARIDLCGQRLALAALQYQIGERRL
jgi:hypothetical protein